MCSRIYGCIENAFMPKMPVGANVCNKTVLLSVYLLVLLLLSVFTVQGSACDDLKSETINNLRSSIQDEEKLGFVS